MTIPDEEAVKVPVIVKPLEWRMLSNAFAKDTFGDRFAAWGAGVLYVVSSTAWAKGNEPWFYNRATFATAAAAQAAAQSDFTNAILSALSPTTPYTQAPGSGEKVPAGWRLVPVEPTEAMLSAVWSIRASNGKDIAATCYAAMLASAPSASIGAMGAGGPVAWTSNTGIEFLARGYGIDVSAEKGTMGRNVPLYTALPAETQAGDNEEGATAAARSTAGAGVADTPPVASPSSEPPAS